MPHTPHFSTSSDIIKFKYSYKYYYEKPIRVNRYSSTEVDYESGFIALKHL